jgi:hypothetical protein
MYGCCKNTNTPGKTADLLQNRPEGFFYAILDVNPSLRDGSQTPRIALLQKIKYIFLCRFSL